MITVNASSIIFEFNMSEIETNALINNYLNR